MMWLFQRVVFGRAPGELPDPHDGELTDEERAELAAAGAHHGGHGHAAPCRSPAAPTLTTPATTAAHAEIWPDLTLKEGLTLVPLAVLTIVTGIFPGPIFDIVEPAFQRILRSVPVVERYRVGLAWGDAAEVPRTEGRVENGGLCPPSQEREATPTGVTRCFRTSG